MEVCTGQAERMPLYLRTGDFSASHGVHGLSCCYSAWLLYKSLIYRDTWSRQRKEAGIHTAQLLNYREVPVVAEPTVRTIVL